jgi:hypothetical protein
MTIDELRMTNDPPKANQRRLWLEKRPKAAPYETPPRLNSKQIERRTSNVEHRTSNMDGATLYRF